MKTKSVKLSTREMAYIALFAVLIAVCSWISIPTTVPFTLQTIGVFLAVGLLGGRRGSIAVCVYLLLGAVGVPVFSGFTGGVGILLGNTGGYLVGFLASSLLMWAWERCFGRSLKALALSMVLGLLVCYAVGTLWFLIVYTRSTGAVGLWTVLGWCVFPFVVPDLLKIALALLLTKRLKPFVKMN